MSINYATTNKLRHIQINIVSCQFSTFPQFCSEMRVKKNGNSGGDGGSSQWGLKRKIFRGEVMYILWNYTL